ncbi:MAG: GAF domain-containing protein [Deltaproteobacteria bacterium]|nr:GAF domain-containing protein [Deltaproteobacteria bacterium]
MNFDLSLYPSLFQGVVPSVLATCDAEGTPNITYVSQVHYVDSRHVALSRQFFNKTSLNLEQHPLACVELLDPVTLQPYRMKLRFLRSETSGPLFEAQSLRIQVIASHTGMSGIFKLIAADVFEVVSFEKVVGALDPSAEPPPLPQLEGPTPMTELRGLQEISCRINRTRDLDELLDVTLAALDELFGFHHAMVLLPDDSGRRLVTIASRGYGESGVGAEVELGQGLIGTVAETRQIIRVAGINTELRYGRAVRGQLAPAQQLRPEIPLPGLPDAQSQLALPLLVHDRLVGVLAIESRQTLQPADWHEAFLQVVANQIAIGIENAALREEPEEPEPTTPPKVPVAGRAQRRRRFAYFRHDECVFVDDEYLIRNVPGKILWKLLSTHRLEGRDEFSNRELRLDQGLGLPALRDNLESRLILLRRRLEQKCPEVRLVPTRRGHFRLELDCELDLVERA